MKRWLIVFCVLGFLCNKLPAQITTQIEGVYVWNPGEDFWAVSPLLERPHKRKNIKPSQIVWDSLFVYPDSSFLLKRSRFYDVGGKTVVSVLEGGWSSRGDYVAFVPREVNYSCAPNVTTDSIILVNLAKIEQITRDTVPVKKGLLYAYSENGAITKYYTDSIGHVEINYSPDILAVFIEGGFSPKIPFPQMGNRYDIVITESFVIPNIDALFFIKYGDDLWTSSKNQYKRVVEKANKCKKSKRLKERKKKE